MSGVNHITGGIIFTGIFTSFWNVNIFAKPEYLSLCAFTSILPDIDHTKSPIGKLFYPLAKYLDRNFGHRTITHSLLGFITLLIIAFSLEKIGNQNLHISLIFTFSYASHLIFDMMTKEGVPLLYPFNKNPCVIPGNPDKRLKSGHFKTECIIFCLLIPIGISCKSLFEQGFWTTFDRAFGTLKHINYEFRESPQLIQLTYEATYLGKEYQGQGYVVFTTPNKAIIFNKNSFLELNNHFQITKLIPTKTATRYKIQDLSFQDISLDSLHRLIHNKPLLEFHTQANNPIRYLKDHKTNISAQVDLSYTFNPKLTWEHKEDSATTTKAQDFKYKLQQLQKDQWLVAQKQRNIQTRIHNLSHTIPQMGTYKREKATQELKHLKNELASLDSQPYQKKTEEIKFKLSQLKEKPKPICSGYIQYLQLQE